MKTRLFSTLLLICSISFSQIPTNGLTAQYEFTNGSFVDNINNVDFIHSGTALINVNDRFGNPSNAISLNGDNLTRSNLSGNDITYSFWIKTSTNSGTDKTIIDDSKKSGTDNAFSGPAYDTGYSIMLSNGNIKAQARFSYSIYPSTGFEIRTATSGFIADGNWHHVVVRFVTYRPTGYQNKFGRATVYIDGVLVEKTSGSLPTTTGAGFDSVGDMAIGHNRNKTINANYRYNDVIDDILVYNRGLSNQEILNIRNVGGFCFPYSNTFFAAGLVTENSVNVVMSASGTYELAYHKHSEPFSSATIVTVSNNTEVTVNDLDASTEYDFYLRSIYCATWSVAKTIRTSGVIYVSKTASGLNDGSSWANAYTNLTDALNNASENSQLWVASGTYNPHLTLRTATFEIEKPGLKIYGGFAGTETTIADRTYGANPTILSGDLQDDDVNVAGFVSSYANATRNGDNSYHLINITANGNNLLLDGLTISDAHTNVSGTEIGGAILKDKTVANLTLKNCIIKDNVSRNTNAGLLAEFNLNNASGVRGSLVIENCKFINNMSRGATGIYAYVRVNTNVNITIVNSLFEANIATDLSSTYKGLGASASWIRNMGTNSDVNVHIANNTYVNNIDQSTTYIESSTGVVAISKTGSSGAINATISNSIFWGNKGVSNAVANSVNNLYEYNPTTMLVSNSISEIGFTDTSITSTISTNNSNPMFADEANNDFTLQSGSPAINTGDNTRVLSGMTTDLLGKQRIFNTTVDMGAYEFGSTVLGVNDNFNMFLNEVTIYPNPTVTNLNIKMDSNLKRAVIYSVLGSKVLETTSKKITTANLKNGLYLIKIESENGTVSTKKFMKK